jgi:hypothetical protein
MTTYAASRNFGGVGVPSIGVLAGTYPIRIARVEFWGYAQNSTGAVAVNTQVNNVAGASFTGGTAITSLPMRGGAPPSTATVKYGYSGMGGTRTYLTILTAGGSAGGSLSSYTFPFDYIVPPGGAIDVASSGTLTNQFAWCVIIYYEELRLAWSF